MNWSDWIKQIRYIWELEDYAQIFFHIFIPKVVLIVLSVMSQGLFIVINLLLFFIAPLDTCSAWLQIHTENKTKPL